MGNNYNDEIWEALVKAAVIKNNLNKFEEDSFEKIDHEVPPASFDLKMKRLIKRLRFQKFWRTALQHCKKAASIILLIIGIGFAVLLQFEEVRAACRNVITSIHEKYIQFTFTDDLSDATAPVKLNYIPNGYQLAGIHSTKFLYDVTYSNSKGDTIRVLTSAKKYVYQIDKEHYDIYEIELNHGVGQFFKSQDARFENFLIWNVNDNYYILQTTIADENEIEKIAENIE